MVGDISIDLLLCKFILVGPSLTHSCGAILALMAVQVTFELELHRLATKMRRRMPR